MPRVRPRGLGLTGPARRDPALLTQEQIADCLGIRRTTFRRLLQRDPGIEARGKAKAIAPIAQGLLTKACAGTPVSSVFYLKIQAGWRETDRLEHSGPDGGAIMVDRAMVKAGGKHCR
jgi:hypothetical protein